MAYVAPTTLSTGCLVSAASWNQNCVNNILAIVASPLTIDFINDRVGVLRSSPAYALDVKANTNLSTAIRVFGGISTTNYTDIRFGGASSNAELFGIGTDTVNTGQKHFDIYDLTNSLYRYHISASGAHVINSGTCNTFNSKGLTIQQGNALLFEELLSLKNGCLLHGMTTDTETDTFGLMKIVHITNGALWMQGFGASHIGEYLHGIATLDDTRKTTLAAATVIIRGSKKSGTTFSSMGACANILVVRDDGLTRFIFRQDGDLYADAAITASAYDTHDDVSLVRALELERQPGSVVRDVFDSWIQYNRRDLEAADIATFNDGPGEDGSVFVNITGLQRLHSGAIWQMHKAQHALEDRLAQLERRLLGPPKDTHAIDTG